MKRIFAHLLADWQIWTAGALAGVLVLTAYTAFIDHRGFVRGKSKAETKITERIVRVTGKETVRRETALEKVQVRSAADVRKLDQQATKIAELMAESRRLSTAYDNAPCLTPDAVARLAAVGWGK